MAHVESYVSLPDSGQPVVFFRPYFLRKTGWLQMRKMTVTVDDKALFERAFESSLGLSADGKQRNRRSSL